MNSIAKLAHMGITYNGDSSDLTAEADELFSALHHAYHNRQIDDEGALWQHARDLVFDGSWAVEEIGGLALNYERWLEYNHQHKP